MSIYIQDTGRFEDGEPIKVVRFDRQQPTQKMFEATGLISAFLLDLFPEKKWTKNEVEALVRDVGSASQTAIRAV